MRTKKKNRGITALKARYGWICVAPWALGLVLFFIWPVIQSVVYSFCKVNLSAGGMNITFLGLDNFKYIFMENANYLDFMVESLVKFLYSFPVILVLSLILALILNQRFRGRLFFRALYFLPVIIASGAVLKTILSSTAAGVSNMQQDESIAMSMFSVSELVTEDDWAAFEGFCKSLSGREDIWYCTNIEAIKAIQNKETGRDNDEKL